MSFILKLLLYEVSYSLSNLKTFITNFYSILVLGFTDRILNSDRKSQMKIGKKLLYKRLIKAQTH